MMKQAAKFGNSSFARTYGGKALGSEPMSNAWEILFKQGLRESDK